MSSQRKAVAKRIAVAIAGGTITLVGIAMIVLPGPAIVVIPLGLSILATEFAWARGYLRRCRAMAMHWKDRSRTRAAATTPNTPPASSTAARVRDRVAR